MRKTAKQMAMWRRVISQRQAQDARNYAILNKMRPPYDGMFLAEQRYVAAHSANTRALLFELIDKTNQST
jgi:hypothetical protein